MDASCNEELYESLLINIFLYGKEFPLSFTLNFEHELKKIFCDL